MGKISMVIPAFNEAENIGGLVAYLLKEGGDGLAEVIVVDGGSSDETLRIAAQAGARAVLSPKRGRAAQMNYGASLAKGDTLYFLHADTYPPPSFVNDIETGVTAGFGFGGECAGGVFVGVGLNYEIRPPGRRPCCSWLINGSRGVVGGRCWQIRLRGWRGCR